MILSGLTEMSVLFLRERLKKKKKTIPEVINSKGKQKMKVRYNEDENTVKMIKEGLEKKGGYCPCRVARTEDNKCMCREFRDQIADPDFEGYCHCMLYYKEK